MVKKSPDVSQDETPDLSPEGDEIFREVCRRCGAEVSAETPQRARIELMNHAKSVHPKGSSLDDRHPDESEDGAAWPLAPQAEGLQRVLSASMDKKHAARIREIASLASRYSATIFTSPTGLRGFLSTMGVPQDAIGIAVVDAFGVGPESAAGAGSGWGAWPAPPPQPTAAVGPGQRETTLTDTLELVKAVVEMVKESSAPAGETTSPQETELRVENERLRLMMSFREQMDAVVGPLQAQLKELQGQPTSPESLKATTLRQLAESGEGMVERTLVRIEELVRPGMVLQQAEGLRKAGLNNETIAAMLQTQMTVRPAAPTSGGLREKIAAAQRRWIKSPE